MKVRTALIFATILAPLSVFADEVPAEPKWKGAPDYPVSCYPAGDDKEVEHRVDVAFAIDKDGLTENVRIMRSTDPCFEEASISAVRSWTYEPRKVDGRARPQEDMEATIVFVFKLTESQTGLEKPAIEARSRALVFDARPIERIPPRYPNRCYSRAYREERVLLRFDVTTEGETHNAEVVESTNECFDQAAVKSVDGWLYEPKTIDGVPTDRVGVETMIIFVSEGNRVRPENVIRPVAANRLNRARRLLKQEKPEEALLVLKEFDSKYGDTLTPAELAEFHRIRGLARLGAKDYEGALDDFRTAQRLGVDDKNGALGRIIGQLEAALNVPSEDSEATSNDESTPSE